MKEPEPIVYVVDDDAGIRDALGRMFESLNIRTEKFASAGDFLNHYQRGRPGCLVLDLRMPGMSGLDLQDRLVRAGDEIPVIMISGHGDVTTAVEAMKRGALDFIQKPFSLQLLLDRVQRAIEIHRARLRRKAAKHEILRRLAMLTVREKEVLSLVVDGRKSKDIASDLGLSPKTVEVHRAKVMEKMRAKSVQELVRMSLTADEA